MEAADGKADLVAFDKSLYVYYNIGKEEFSEPVVIPLPVQIDQVNSGDANGDGKPDLLVTGAQVARVYLSLGNGFAAPIDTPWSLPEPGIYGRLHLADMDGDGKLDVFGAVGPTAVLRGKGDGTFFPTKYLNTELVRDLETADLNNDGRVDLVACTYDMKMKVWLLNPDATLITDGGKAFKGMRILLNGCGI